MQDPSLREWWKTAAQFRRGGFDRILVPAPWSPTSDELVAAGIRGNFYAHELVGVAAGDADAFLEEVRQRAVPIYESLGLSLVGAFHTAMIDRSECLLLWAIPDHSTWAAFEAAEYGETDLASWRADGRDRIRSWHRILLVEAPTSTLRLGRQPSEADRRPLDEIA
jgi:hypothetical protein